MNELALVPLGSFTILTNTNFLQGTNPSTELAQAISDKIVNHFKSRLSEFNNTEHVVVTDVHTENGCIITVVSLGAIVTSVYVFVKDYDKLRTNLRLIIDDFKNAYFKITTKKNDDSKYSEAPLLQDALPEVDLRVEDKKYFLIGLGIVPFNENEEPGPKNGDSEKTNLYTSSAVMSEDIVEYFDESTVQIKIVITKKDASHTLPPKS